MLVLLQVVFSLLALYLLAITFLTLITCSPMPRWLWAGLLLCYFIAGGLNLYQSSYKNNKSGNNSVHIFRLT